jgi:hypothetical protein
MDATPASSLHGLLKVSVVGYQGLSLYDDPLSSISPPEL